jgi:integrase
MKLQAALVAYLRHLENAGASETHLLTVRSRLRQFIDTCPETAVSAITAQQLQAHFRQLRDGRADATMAGYASTHRAFWNWCAAEGLRPDSPAANLKRWDYSPVRRRAAPENDIIQVANSLAAFADRNNKDPRDVRDALAVSIAIDGGGRLGEIRSLKKNDLRQALIRPVAVDGDREAFLVIGYGKTGDAPLIFFNETAVFARAWLEMDPQPTSTWVFYNLRTGGLLRSPSLSRAFARVCEFVGVPVFRSHAIRKRNVTKIIGATGNIKIGSLYAGHKNSATTIRHYNDVDEEMVIAAASRVAASRRPSASPGDDLAAQLFGGKKKGGDQA